MANVQEPRAAFGALARVWWILLVFGIISVIAGIIILVEPGISIVTLAWISGAFLLVDGVFELLDSLGRGTESRGMLAVLGVISIIAGLILLRHPVASVLAIGLLLGVWFLATGLVRLFEVFGRSETHRVWNLIAAGVEVIAGIIIVADPTIGVTLLAIIVGIAFILRGIGMALAAWALRSATAH